MSLGLYPLAFMLDHSIVCTKKQRAKHDFKGNRNNITDISDVLTPEYVQSWTLDLSNTGLENVEKRCGKVVRSIGRLPCGKNV